MTFADFALPDPTPNPEAARVAFNSFLEKTPKNARVVCLCDTDADGIAAGVLWELAMRDIAYSKSRRVLPDRERNAWTSENQRRVRETKPDALFVLDLGNQPVDVVEVPTCFVDHHRPEQTRADQTLISAYSWKPVPNTSLIVHDLFAPLTDISCYDWIAAIGTFSDLGERAPFDLVEATKKKYTAKWLKEATALVNAVRRASDSNPEAAARALLKFSSPKALCLSDDDADVLQMKAAREEVKAALDEAKKAAPIFSGQVALIRTHSKCQIHPLIAQIWRGRLPKYIVICANDLYLEGRINFSARSGNGTNVLEFLRNIQISDGEGDFGHGHDGASGGSLPPHRWNELLAKMGFAPDVFALKI